MNPLQMLLYKALGFEPPIFGHMSLILAADKSKLSKRCAAAQRLSPCPAPGCCGKGCSPKHSLRP